MTTRKFTRPMKGVPAPTNPDEQRFPVWGSFKLDGIRCVISEGIPKSYKLKPIPNRHVNSVLQSLALPPLDGELMVDGCTDFSQVTSAIMSESGWPNFTYNVFDLLPANLKTPFCSRFLTLREFVKDHREAHPQSPVRLVSHWVIEDREALESDMESALERGYEGLILRDPLGPYKFGRATLKEGYLLKVKKMHDAEAVIVATSELMRNENEQTRDALGLAERSTAKAGQVPAGTLGALRVEWKGNFFNIGSGYTAAVRAQLWSIRDQLIGKQVKFKYQNVGSKGAPRFPIFLGLRHKDD